MVWKKIESVKRLPTHIVTVANSKDPRLIFAASAFEMLRNFKTADVHRDDRFKRLMIQFFKSEDGDHRLMYADKKAELCIGKALKQIGAAPGHYYWRWDVDGLMRIDLVKPLMQSDWKKMQHGGN